MNKNTDLRVLKTKRALYNAFFDMLTENNFDTITVNSLCDRAMIRRATFYNHYLDKYDFFAHFVRYVRDEKIGDKNRHSNNDSLLSYYTVFMESFIEFSMENKSLFQNILSSKMRPALLDILTSETYKHMLDILQTNMHRTANTSNHILASFCTGGIIQVMLFWLTQPTDMTGEELLSNVIALLSNFLSNNPDFKK